MQTSIVSGCCRSGEQRSEIVTTVVCVDEFLDVWVLAIQACNVASIHGHLITPQHLRDSIHPFSCQAHAAALSSGINTREFFCACRITLVLVCSASGKSCAMPQQHLGSLTRRQEDAGIQSCEAQQQTYQMLKPRPTVVAGSYTECPRNKPALCIKGIKQRRPATTSWWGHAITLATASRFWGSKLTQR